MSWRRALKRAGIKDFRWHAQYGTPLNVLQELGGWESLETLRRYAHLSGEHLSGYARSMTGNLGAVATV